MKPFFFPLVSLVLLLSVSAPAETMPADSLFSEKTVQEVREKGGSAVLDGKEKITLETKTKSLAVPVLEKFGIQPLSLIRYEISAEGTGKFGFVIYFYNKEGRRIGYKTVLPAFKNGKLEAKGAFRIGETYKNQIPASVSICAYIAKNSKAAVDNFAFDCRKTIGENSAIRAECRKDWSASYSSRLTQEAARRKNVPVLFLGDSITIGWLSSPKAKYPGGRDSWNQYFEPMDALNFGIAADTTSNLLWRVTEGRQLACNPKIIVLLIGTNNLHHQKIINSGAETAEGIIHLVNVIQKQLPETKIILLGVFPRKALDNHSDFPIPAINAMLAKHPWNQNVIYRDYSALLLGKSGKVTREIFRDGVHLSPEAYALLAPELAKEIKALQK